LAKSRKSSTTNRFHIYPRRRFPKLKAKPENVTIVDIRKHEAYHELFGLRTPEEVIEYLNRYFWVNRFDITIARTSKGGGQP